MKTKSFVNGLDPENTVKGYYDENDQLVMLEPEGSGGGGDLTTAKVTLISAAGLPPRIDCAILDDGVLKINTLSIKDPYFDYNSVLLGPNGYEAAVPVGYESNFSVTDGSAVYNDGVLIITGDCTITFSGGE